MHKVSHINILLDGDLTCRLLVFSNTVYSLLRFRAFRAFKIIRMALFEVYEFPKLISQKVQVTEKNSHIVATYLKNYFVKSTV